MDQTINWNTIDFSHNIAPFYTDFTEIFGYYQVVFYKVNFKWDQVLAKI